MTTGTQVGEETNSLELIKRSSYILKRVLWRVAAGYGMDTIASQTTVMALTVAREAEVQEFERLQLRKLQHSRRPNRPALRDKELEYSSNNPQDEVLI